MQEVAQLLAVKLETLFVRRMQSVGSFVILNGPMRNK